MYCKNCGQELSEDGMFCSHCGTKREDVSENLYEVSKDDPSAKISKSKKFTMKQQIGAMIIVLAIAIFAFIGWQYSLVNKAKSLYDKNDYEAAYNTKKFIMNTASLGDYKDNIDVMYNVTLEYNRFRQMDSDDRLRQVFAWFTLQKCVGYTLVAQESGCIDEVVYIASDVVVWLHKRGNNIQYSLKEQYKKSSFDFIPLSDTATDEEVENIIDVYAKLVPDSN
ncbi:zinc-ribbon domain-containing protein [Lacrimispora sp. AGF001]|uniref:zinc-ribbon domain-containing protein n=1 Tax=Lacrimispora sp. AGF001 TaxID=3401631 RepID=UPI003B437E98